MRHTRTAGTFAIVLVALLGGACGLLGVSRSDLVGDFQINYGYGVETLRLMGDGTYRQLVRLAEESTWTTHSGKWDFKSDDAPKVELSDALVLDDGAGKPRTGWQQPVTGLRVLPVERGFRALSLVVDAARGLTMTRLAPPPASDHKPAIIHLPPRNDVEVN